MNNKLNRYIGGLAIILIGIVLLLRNLDFFYFNDEYVVGLIFGSLGFLFFIVYARDTKKWWAAIPGVGGLIVFISIFIDRARFIPDGFIGAGVGSEIVVGRRVIFGRKSSEVNPYGSTS